MDVSDLIRDYGIDQEDTMKKLITFFLNLVMKQSNRLVLLGMNVQINEKLTVMENAVVVSKQNTVTSFLINLIYAKNHLKQLSLIATAEWNVL